MATQGSEGMRLDKWLWCARFFKTRKLAAEAVEGGKVHLHGQRTKPGKEIRVGSRIEIRKEGVSWDIEVLVLPKQRRPASEARTFYAEDQASITRREQQQAAQRAVRLAPAPRTDSKPNKRDRRLLERMKHQG